MQKAALTLALLASLLAASAWTDDPPPAEPVEELAFPSAEPLPSPPAPAAAPEADPVETAEAAPAEDEEEVLPPLPPGAIASGPPPQRFDPSEKVRADFPVSFPADI